MSRTFFTSESVASGHPDKIADQISDAILDAYLAIDCDARVACETLVSTGLVFLAGEISSDARVDHQEVVRRTIKEIGYDHSSLGFDYHSCAILSALKRQSPDIAQGVSERENPYQQLGAGDQGMMFGFACDETPELMPLPIMLANRLVLELGRLRRSKELAYLQPDAKTQVTVEYRDGQPLRVETVVISTQHSERTSQEEIQRDMQAMAKRVIPPHLLDAQTKYFVNPTGRFVIGGPLGDCGLTGRKIMVDTYGSMGRHGGGCFSGKDPTKVDRSAAYAARYVAKNIVAAKLAKRCEVQLAYAIGYPHPLSIKVDTFGTSSVSEEALVKAVLRVFDLSPKGIIHALDLKRPIYRQTAFGGHFGREEAEFTWERVDRVSELLEVLKKSSA